MHCPTLLAQTLSVKDLFSESLGILMDLFLWNALKESKEPIHAKAGEAPIFLTPVSGSAVHTDYKKT